ncbi:MAG: 1-acyl-sn-glycerol-3-phosphate acyltransferase, partial [Spirochaetes bacterium]|nr:1-acyl-sn-glycerol-3-phosphate acyltransferase [Spirochaetota bacterium]
FIWTIGFFYTLLIPKKWLYPTAWPIFFFFFLKACKIKVHFTGTIDLKSQANTIFIANHRSFADTFIITYLLRKPFTIAYTSWMTKNPFFNLVANKMALIPLAKKDLIQQKNGLKIIEKMLQKKYSLIYFPEGRFVFDKAIGQLQRGIAKIAKDSKCTVIPLAIYGSGIKQDFLFDNMLVNKDIYVDCGDPVKYSDFSDDDNFIKYLTESLSNKYQYLEKKYSN